MLKKYLDSHKRRRIFKFRSNLISKNTYYYSFNYRKKNFQISNLFIRKISSPLLFLTIPSPNLNTRYWTDKFAPLHPPTPPPRLTRKLARRSTLPPLHRCTMNLPRQRKRCHPRRRPTERRRESVSRLARIDAMRDARDGRERGGGGRRGAGAIAVKRRRGNRSLRRAIALSLSLYPRSLSVEEQSFFLPRKGEGGGRKMRKSSGGPSAAVIGLIYGTNN